MLTQARLKELLHYDPISGAWAWIVSRSNIKAGQPAGVVNGLGYLVIRIDGKLYYAHRLAFLYVLGAFPARGVDHKNGDESDCRWENLREANQTQNIANARRRAKTASGLKGVSKKKKKWEAVIRAYGERRRLGIFDCPAAAHFAYIVEADRLFGEFARAS